MDDFSNAPISIGEARERRDGNAANWTVRDALISVLRDIDAGNSAPTHAVLILATETDDGTHFEYVQRVGSALEAKGMIATAAMDIHLNTKRD